MTIKILWGRIADLKYYVFYLTRSKPLIIYNHFFAAFHAQYEIMRTPGSRAKSQADQRQEENYGFTGLVVIQTRTAKFYNTLESFFRSLRKIAPQKIKASQINSVANGKLQRQMGILKIFSDKLQESMGEHKLTTGN